MEDKIMTLMRINPQLPSLFDRFFDTDLFDWTHRNFSDTNTTLPSVNIKEDVNGYEVEMAAPGLDKSDFRIDLKNNVLSISSEKKTSEESDNGKQFTRREYSYQSFCRSFSLPQTVESDKISARYEQGILKVSIPKREEAKPKPSRQIEIQ